MRNSGLSLSRSLYHSSGALLLHGELGAGKTTFVQGLAAGLGIKDRVTSPTYALEQRYGDVLSHIDLYRLKPDQAADFLQALDPFPGLRVIEWSDRAGDIEAGIVVSIEEKKDFRAIKIEFRDINLPTKKEMKQWMKDVHLPGHIAGHVEQVAKVTQAVAADLQKQGRAIRPQAVEAAALVHDLLRFVDFKSLTGDAFYSPSPEETVIWTDLKKRYGTPHELAIEKFLIDKGYPDLGRIVRTHRGHSADASMMPSTIEQTVLCYSDKRALHDKAVTLDERFDDFMKRYGKGVESDDAKEWRKNIHAMERDLSPSGALSL